MTLIMCVCVCVCVCVCMCMCVFVCVEAQWQTTITCTCLKSGFAITGPWTAKVFCITFTVSMYHDIFTSNIVIKNPTSMNTKTRVPVNPNVLWFQAGDKSVIKMQTSNVEGKHNMSIC